MIIDCIISPNARQHILRDFEKLDKYGTCSNGQIYYSGMLIPTYVYEIPKNYFIRREIPKELHSQVTFSHIDKLSSLLYCEDWISLDATDIQPRILTQSYISLQHIWTRWLLQTTPKDVHVRVTVRDSNIYIIPLPFSDSVPVPEIFFQLPIV